MRVHVYTGGHPVNTWFHLAETDYYDGEFLRMYVDGV